MTDACARCGLKEAPYYDVNGLCPMCSPFFANGNLQESPETEPGDFGTMVPKTKRSTTSGKRSVVTEADFVRNPDRTMLALAHIKNNESLSWRELADEYFPDYSHAYIRKVAIGEAQCDDIDIALGFKEKPPRTVSVPPCPECGEVHEQYHTCTDELRKARQRPKRIRSHYEHGRGPDGLAHKAQLQAEMDAAGVSSFTEYVDRLRHGGK